MEHGFWVGVIMKRKILLFFAFVLCTVPVLSSCTLLKDARTQTNITFFVKGAMDSVFKGELDEVYLELTNVTEAREREVHAKYMKECAEYFARCTGLIDEGESLSENAECERIIALVTKIYGASKYEINETQRQSDGSYIVKIWLDPIDIILRAGELETGEPMLESYEALAENISYATRKTFEIRVTESKGSWYINEEDFYLVSTCVVLYP